MRLRAVFVGFLAAQPACLVVQDLGQGLDGAGGASTAGQGGAGASTSVGTSGASPLDAPGLACVGDVELETTDIQTMATRLRVRRWDTDARVGDAAIRLCSRTSGACGAPVTTDADGEVPLTLPFEPLGYLGYLDIEHKTAPIRNLRFFVPPIRTNRPLIHAQVFPRALAADLYAALGVQAPTDQGTGPDLGTIGVGALDCDGVPLAGATVAVDAAGPETFAAYFHDKQVDPTATATDAAGFAILVQVPAGPTVVRLKVGDTEIGAAPVVVRKGAVSTLELSPTPAGAWWL